MQSSALSAFSSQRALRHRRLGPSPRPTILRRQNAVSPVSIGTTSTFHVSAMDAPRGPNPMEQSTTSLFSSALSASSKQNSSMASTWAPSVPASSQASVDRKWLSRVAPISCLPSGANTSAVRQEMMEQERARLMSKRSTKKSLRAQKTLSALNTLTVSGRPRAV
eukprot:g11213.t1